VFVNHVTTGPFFVPCRYGIADACALLGCDYQWTGSETSDVAQMAIAGKADAIATCIVDPHGFDRPIARAMDSGIPVWSYNADAPHGSGNRRLAYVGQDLFLSGQLMGRRIVNLVKEGDVAIFIATPGQLNLQPRVDGAMDAIKKSGANIDATMIATDPTVNAGLSKIRAYYLGHPNIRGMFGTGGGDTMNTGLVMRQYDLPKKGIQAGGFDMLPRSLEAVHDGFLDFVIDQQPYLQGFYTVMEMFAFKVSGGLVGPADINTGLKFVTKGSIGPYLNTQTRYEGKSAAPQIVPRPSGPIAG
jgi:simple sugar transport system substrate-binding protein